MSRTDGNISIYEKKILRIIFGEIKGNSTWRRRSNLEFYHACKENLTSLTSSKYSELNGPATLSERRKTATLKKVFNVQLSSTRRKGRPNLILIDGLEKTSLFLRTKKWRTLTGKRMVRKKASLRRPRPTLGCRATEEGRKKRTLFLVTIKIHSCYFLEPILQHFLQEQAISLLLLVNHIYTMAFE
ncbi:uncharacterized protein TNCV_1488351 [Trichonephila clavipes]|nr:uncharacterized protein TNCV_1488351 [Trichonephila clavipes]